ncbi:hypothetical protein SAMN04488133_2338 [Halobellus limi]|uniref:Uncharacterized protein n=2 Tax=Halobellus limi TaxID=699433 RepID=A0A1H6AIS7_9EURY|nr:hypothetical protein SAMN04488133_2338 [Halobellus limi]
MLYNNTYKGVMGAAEQPSTGEKKPVPTPQTETTREATDGSLLGKFIAKRVVNKGAYIRLRSELTAARPEFEQLVEQTDAEGESWVKHGRELLARAEANLRRGEIEEAWRALHTARRFEVYGLEALAGQTATAGERSELQIRARVVHEEALDELVGWRRRAVVDILCDEHEQLREGITGSELRAASRLLHEQYERVYLRRSERQREFNQLVLMGTLSGLALLVLTLADWSLDAASTAGLASLLEEFLATPFDASPGDVATPGFAVFMTVVGVMGASLFGIRTLRNQSLSTKIPQHINQLTVTSARGVIGAISALLFYFVLQTPLLTDGAILADGVVSAPMMAVVAFAAGYTERMAPGVVAKVASITDTDDSNASSPSPDSNAATTSRPASNGERPGTEP